VTSLRCNDAIHDFTLFNPRADAPAGRAAVAQASAYLRPVLTPA
jgi:hypothetical protein